MAGGDPVSLSTLFGAEGEEEGVLEGNELHRFWNFLLGFVFSDITYPFCTYICFLEASTVG